MIGLFPERTRHPDELFYSLCARYRDIVRYRLTRAVFYDLFRSEIPIVSTLLARKLGVFINQLPPGHGLTVDAIIDNHTLLPFFAPFLLPERVKRLRENMVEGAYTTPVDAGIYSDQIKLPDTLRFCPLCVAEERKRFGACYWHRLHQVPGVEVCPIHQTWLESSQVPIILSSHPNYISAEQVVPNVEASFLDTSNFSHKVLLEIANDFSWLGKQQGLVLDREVMQQRYIAVLVERGLASYQGEISLSKLLTSFRQYYPEKLLELLHCNLDEAIEVSWIIRLLRPAQRVYHPLYHLLFINFLGYKLFEFIDLPTEYQPFGIAPWPCLNPVCQQYLKWSIEHVVVRYNLIGGKPHGTFTCNECGFTYFRSGPDQSTDDQFRRNRHIKVYGPVWDKMLINLWLDESLMLEQIAAHLGVGIKTLKKQAARLGLKISSSGQRWQREVQVTVSTGGDATNDMAAKSESYRTEWLAALKQEASLGSGAFITKYRRVYTWLKRNNPEWLLENMPPKLKNKKPLPLRIDWASHDLELAKQVRAAAIYLRNQIKPFRQVTKTAIGRTLKKTNHLAKQLDKLPLTVKALNEVLETKEQFAFRRIWRVAEIFCHEKMVPTQAQLVKLASVNDYMELPAIVEALSTALELLGQPNPDCQLIKAHLPANIVWEISDLPLPNVGPDPVSNQDLQRELISDNKPALPETVVDPTQNSLSVPTKSVSSINHVSQLRRYFSSAEKLRILDELDACTEFGEKTAIIKREGLYSSHITQWRRARAEGRLTDLIPDLPSD